VEEAGVIDFTSDESHLLLNPRLPAADRAALEMLHAAMPAFPAHVWIATSGSTGGWKLVALSKAALLVSAAAVNRHLRVAGGEAWCCVLPTFHVGGLGIYARASISGGRVVGAEWEARGFAELCEREEVAFSSLVPAQVVDLVCAGLRAPESLRAIVVGGGVMPDELYRDARRLGWPVLPSYGMTECCSQIATADHSGPELLLLDHVEARREDDGRLTFASPALLTGYGLLESKPRFEDPKTNGWFLSDDRGLLEGRVLRVEGRASEVIKVGGELVDLRRLDALLGEVLTAFAGVDGAIVAGPDPRLGNIIYVALTEGRVAEAVGTAFAERVLPFERARKVFVVKEIPRSALGKLLRRKLAEQLSENGWNSPLG
jgi:O-succinylbenzoic acid--CoA ligase